MQTVSKEWVKNQRDTISPEGFVEVSLRVTDPELELSTKTTTNQQHATLSSVTNIANRVCDDVPSFVTLEQNAWALNGARKFVSDGLSAGQELAYVSDALCDDKGSFGSSPPQVIINVNTNPNPIPAITIVWGESTSEYPTTFTIVLTYTDAPQQRIRITDNKSCRSVVDIADATSGLSRVVVSMNNWCLPNHRARIEGIILGMDAVFPKTKLLSYTHERVFDPLSTSLPSEKVSFTIDNTDGEYDPFAEHGISKGLNERQVLKTRYGNKKSDGSIEWIDGNTAYLSEWSIPTNGISASFVARDVLDMLSAPYTDKPLGKLIDCPLELYVDGALIPLITRSVRELMESVVESAGVSPDTLVFDDDVPNIPISAPLPKESCAVCLQLLANAVGMALYIGRDGRIHVRHRTFTPRSVVDDNTYHLSEYVCYQKPEVTLGKPVGKVIVKFYEYFAKVKESPVTDEDGNETGTTRTTFELVTNTTDVTVENEGARGETITLDNPLVSDNPAVAKSWGEELLQYANLRRSLEFDWRADVRLDPLDKVDTKVEWYTDVLGREQGSLAVDNRDVLMTELTYSFDGAFRAKGKGRVLNG